MHLPAFAALGPFVQSSPHRPPPCLSKSARYTCRLSTPSRRLHPAALPTPQAAPRRGAWPCTMRGDAHRRCAHRARHPPTAAVGTGAPLCRECPAAAAAFCPRLFRGPRNTSCKSARAARVCNRHAFPYRVSDTCLAVPGHTRDRRRADAFAATCRRAGVHEQACRRSRDAAGEHCRWLWEPCESFRPAWGCSR